MKYKHTPEDADALAADLIPSNISADIGNANWKTRLAAVEEMTTWLEGVVEQVDSEVVVRFIAKKGWNEKNFQVGMIYSGPHTSADSCIGLSENLRDVDYVVRALQVLREILRCVICPSSKREARRREAQKTGR